MSWIEDKWDQIEKRAIYIVLVVFILCEILSLIFNEISDYMDKKGTVLLLSFVLLAIFRFIDKNVAQHQIKQLSLVKKFSSDIVTLLDKPKYQEINIFAGNSYRYYHAIMESGIKINKLTLLVRSYDDLSTVAFPINHEDKVRVAQSSDAVIRDWQNLKVSGFIKELEIKYYSFDSVLHFMIINNECLHFGLLKPIDEFPGTQLNSSYIVHDNTDTGKEMLKGFILEFNSIKKYST